MDTGQRSLFVSSCTRRELSRRRHTGSPVPIQVIVLLVLLAVALGVFVAAH